MFYFGRIGSSWGPCAFFGSSWGKKVITPNFFKTKIEGSIGKQRMLLMYAGSVLKFLSKK
jgi:hypothetical protein